MQGILKIDYKTRAQQKNCTNYTIKSLEQSTYSIRKAEFKRKEQQLLLHVAQLLSWCFEPSQQRGLYQGWKQI